MSKLYVCIGLPASGKSTWAEKMAEQTNVFVVSSDAIREELFGDPSFQGDNNTVFENVNRRIKQYLVEGADVIFDATNVARKRRKSIFHDYRKITDEIIAVYFATSFEDCLMRNMMRDRKVPYHVFEKMYKTLTLPEWEEGWDKIAIVSNQEAFEIADIVEKDFSENDLFNNPIFEDIYGVDQRNPHHAYSISEHSWRAYQHAKANTEGLSDYEKKLLIWAAAFHDIGKGFCQEWNEEKQRCTSYGHDLVGAQKAVYLLSTTFKPAECLDIGNLIGNHIIYWQNPDLAKERVRHPEVLKRLNEADRAAKGN